MKVKLIPAIIASALLAGCGNGANSGEVTQTSAASVTALATTATTSEPAETESKTEKTNADKSETIPSGEAYEIYPVTLIYNEEEKELPMEKASFSDRLCAEDGTVIYVFSAEYPVFSLGDKAVTDKINKTIESYVMDEFESGKSFAAENMAQGPDMARIYGFASKDTIYFYDKSAIGDHQYSYSVNGDLLSVYLEYEGYGAGAAHGMYGAVNFVFDMKTGDTVDFGNIIGDMDGFSKAVLKGIFLYCGGGSAEEYAKFVNDKNEIDCILNADMTYRIAVRDGALGYFLMPYEFGSFADGIRCIKIPISEALTYFTDEGRELFGGTVSAEAVPASEVPQEEMPVVIPGDKVYEIYPVTLIYPEEEKTDISMEKAYISEDIYNKNGVLSCAFSAEYPIFSGGDKTVTDKINAEIKAYIDGIAESERQAAEKDSTAADDDFVKDFVPSYGALKSYGVLFAHEDDIWGNAGGYNVCGNLLAVDFVGCGYSAGAMHGYEEPVSMLFDLRTGEKVNLNDRISDVRGFARRVKRELDAYIYLHGVGMSEIYKDAEFDDRVNEDNIENWVEYICTSTESGEDYLPESRITAGRGCIGRYLAPYEEGCYADGIRLIEVPIDDILPYLDEEGRELFGDAASAKAEPADVIEYKGARYVSTVSDIPAIHGPLTDGDYVFMSLFPNIKTLELNGCPQIDFEKIAAMDNIKRLYLNDCEFDDISPLFGSNVDSLHGDGGNVTKEQAEEFIEKGGRYISDGLIKAEDGEETK